MRNLILFLACFRVSPFLSSIPCFIDEKKNSIGPGRCQASIDCKGERKCNLRGYCFGDAKCKPERQLGNLYRKAKCNVTEDQYQYCENQFQCQGDRYCVSGKCMGRANCDRYLIKSVLTLYSKASCHIDEKLNDAGEGMCQNYLECKGERSCVENTCVGDHNCEKYIIEVNKNHRLYKKNGRGLYKILDFQRTQSSRLPTTDPLRA